MSERKKKSPCLVRLSTSQFAITKGGYTTQPEYAFWFKDRGWDVEGNGVEPDIELDNPPRATFLGGDAQLDARLRSCKSRWPKCR